MIEQTSHPYPISIFVAGGFDKAIQICRDFCDKEGLCVTVTPTRYVYTNGNEDGVIIGLINYPRFPTQGHHLEDTAKRLGHLLLEGLGQQSFSVQTIMTTFWFSNRPEDQKDYVAPEAPPAQAQKPSKKSS